MEKFRHKSFWTEIPKGSKVLFKNTSAFSKITMTNELFLDETREFDSYGVRSFYVCFQKKPEDIGNRAIAIPVLLDDFISVDAINGEPILKERKKKRERKTSVKEIKKKESGPVEKPTPVKKGKSYGFEIAEKDGRYFCPCGTSFGRRDTAIWCHRKKHLKA